MAATPASPLPNEAAPETAPFAWNGLQLRIPATCRPLALEKNFVRLEDDHGPRLECNWGHAPAAFSMARMLKKTARRMRGAASMDASPEGVRALPDAFRASLDALERRGLQTRLFAWRAGERVTPGAALHDPKARMSLLIRAFPQDESGHELATLGALRLHGPEMPRPWRIFGIEAVTPPGLTLAKFSFRPGAFLLEFADGKETRVTLERFGPASVLLKHLDLRAWVAERLPHLRLDDALCAPEDEAAALARDSLVQTSDESPGELPNDSNSLHNAPAEAAVLWKRPWPAGLRGWLMRRLPTRKRGGPVTLFARLADSQSKILLARMEGRRPLPMTPTDEFSNICKSFHAT